MTPTIMHPRGRGFAPGGPEDRFTSERDDVMLQRTRTSRSIRTCVAVVCTATMLPGFTTTALAASPAQAAAAGDAAVAIPPDQLDSLVAPIALYPDPLLAQVLAASTYPLELLQLHQWLQKNPGLKDKALIDAVSKQPWDPSIQAMAGLPDLVKRLATDIQWTTDLGTAFLAQQDGVMDAVQRMRRKAHDKGTLASTPQQTVQTQVVESQPVIVIEQAEPDVIYVPEYDPLWAYGAPVYPYPSVYYPVGVAALSFGAGLAVGAIWGGGGGWGWGCRWGGNNDITINNNNNFNRNANIRAGNNNLSGRTSWQHRPEHRGGAPYRDRATANKFGGTARGDSLAQRQAGARQQVQRQGGNVRSSGAVGTGGLSDRAGSVGDRTAGTVGDRAAGLDRAGGGIADRAGSVGDRANADPRNFSGTGDRGGNRDLGGSRDLGSSRDLGGSRDFGSSADRIGSRDLGGSDRGSHGAFSSGGGYSGSKARSSSSRGGSSLSRGGGGMSRGGGGGRSRGGGRR